MLSLTNMNASSIAVIVLVFLIGLVLGGVGIWFFGRRRTAVQTTPVTKPETDLSFRLRYVVLPGTIALVTVIVLVALYPSMPSEVAFRFSSSGEPKGLMGRELFVGLMAGIQLIITGLSAAVAFGIIGMARRILKDSPAHVDPGQIIWLMVNMLALPQVIIAFVALDAAYYASTSGHLMTPWLFSILAIGVGTIAIIILFALSFNKTRKAK